MCGELGIAPPTADVRLHGLGERPIREAQAQPDVIEAGGGERIVSVKDRVWFKLKTGRWRAAVVRLTERLIYEQVMVEAVARSLRSGKVITAQFSAYSMGVVIRADRGEQCVAFTAEKVVNVRVLAAVMLDAFPGISNDDWAPEPGGFCGLQPEPGQIIYSAVLPSEVADAILERVPSTGECVRDRPVIARPARRVALRP